MSRKSVTQKAKLQAFIENALCMYCQQPFKGDVEFHHDPPLYLLGPDHDEKPMIPCHKECHARETEKWAPYIKKARHQSGGRGSQSARREKNGPRLQSRNDLTAPKGMKYDWKLGRYVKEQQP